MEQSHGNSNGKLTETLAAEQADSAPATSTPAIRFEALEPRVLLSGDVNPAALSINGSLDAPGQQKQYQFTLQDTKHVVFDSLTNRSDLNWTLTGPNGTVVNGRQFSDDGNYYSGTPAFDLGSGTYTLTVAGSADATGSYAMRIVDATAAASLTPGTAVSDTLVQGNETSVYRFDASAGQQFFFKSNGVSGGTAYWRLIDPYGRQVGGHNDVSGDVDTFSVPSNGEYLLLVEGASGNSAPVDYSFTLNPVVNQQLPLTLDQATTAVLPSGQTNYYSFTLNADTQVLFDSLSNDFNWGLSGPDGQIVQPHYQSETTGAQKLSAGTYTLSIRGYNGRAGSYAFRLLTAASAQTLSTNTQVSGTLDQASSTQLYQVSLSAGQKLYFGSQSPTGGYVNWRLLDPYGNAVNSGGLGGGYAAFSVAATGTYWLALDGYIYNSPTATVGYQFQLNQVPDLPATLSVGTAVNGSIPLAGQSAVYSFHLAAATQLAFDALSNRNDMQWSLSGPRGQEVGSRTLAYSDGSSGQDILALPAGDYTLTVQGSGAAIGNFAPPLMIDTSYNRGAKWNSMKLSLLVRRSIPANVTEATFDVSANLRISSERPERST